MVDVRFDTYYKYDDLTRILQGFAEEYPDLCSIESIGNSYEGRDIWALTVTNRGTGAPEEKPAVYVHGNIHSVEVSTSMACLHLLHTLCTQYGNDDKITYLLDTRTYYIIPRVNPDGVEWALADKPRYRRSSVRPFPYNEDMPEGLVQEDMDGDGRILMMRIEDPNGHWKPHPDEPRLLIRREPDEFGGTYYRVFTEGRIDNYDGFTIKPKPVKEGLDMNRNYPNNWRAQHEQPGAGDFPTSEPEVHAVTQFVSKHRNICIATDLHTMSGVLLRPFSSKPDSDMQAEDLWIYEKQGAKGKDIIGYPDVSIFHGFKYHPNQIISGGGDWMYESLGIFYWAIEIWNPRAHAGIEVEKFIDWWREHPVEDDLKLLKWSDEKLNGNGYIDWYEFDHPQLGKVELGGWDGIFVWTNPPHEMLEAEIETFKDWFIWQGMTTPKLEHLATEVKTVGNDSYRVRFVVHNTGWLPTNVTQVAMKKKITRGVIFEVELSEGASIEAGKVRAEQGQLAGRSHTPSALNRGTRSTGNTADRTVYEWVINAPEGSEITLIARHDRAGTVRDTITLG